VASGLCLAACLNSAAGSPTASPTISPTPRPLSNTLADLETEFAALPAGDPAAGEKAFSASGCPACHALDPEKRIVGPSLAGIGAAAAERERGLSAALYLYQSITRPDAYIVKGFTPGLMPPAFIDTLDSQTQADLIAFLLTLE
jgi:cytochrome c551/c552